MGDDFLTCTIERQMHRVKSMKLDPAEMNSKSARSSKSQSAGQSGWSDEMRSGTSGRSDRVKPCGQVGSSVDASSKASGTASKK